PLGLGRRSRRRGLTRLPLLGPPASAACGYDPAGSALARGPARGHVRLAAGLLVGRDRVGEDVALVDPDLDADAAEGGASLAEAGVGLGSQGVKGHPPRPVGPLAGSRQSTQPGRAVCTSMRSRSRVRSISMRLTAARSSWLIR